MGLIIFLIKVKLGIMKKYIFKLFLAVSLFFAGITSVIYASSVNDLEKVIIDPVKDNTYTISMFFSENYRGKAFIQKIDNGYYNIFLPDVQLNKKKIKANYRNRFDKKNVKLKIEQKPYKNKDYDSSYIRVSVNMNSDYSLRLLSKNIDELNFGFFSDATNVYSLILVSFFLIIFLLIRKISKIISSMNYTNSYTSFPKNFNVPNIELSESTNFKRNLNLKTSKEPEDSAAVESAASLKAADKSSFDCFKIRQNIENINIDTEFSSVIEKTSNLLKEKAKIITNKFKTNPILSAPSQQEENKTEANSKVNELEKIYKSANETPVRRNEILSIIKLSPNRGVYLSKVENYIILYGFIGNKNYPLRRFRDLSQINLQARYYDKNSNNDVFIVRIDDYKAMIEFSRDSIKELAVI